MLGDADGQTTPPSAEAPITEMEAYAARCVAQKLHPSTAAKLRDWGEFDVRYVEVQSFSSLRKYGFVESMGGGMVRLTALGRIAREALL